MRKYLLVGVGWVIFLLGLFVVYFCIFRVIHPLVLGIVLSYLRHDRIMTNEAVVALRIAILFGIFFVIVMLLAVVVTKTDMGAKAKNWFLTINREVFWHP